MLQSLQIENLRGIAVGRLEGFAPLTILTGPNGCGKSTVLDAILIGLASSPSEVGRVVWRRQRLVDGARWLVGDPRLPARVVAETAAGQHCWSLSWRRIGAASVPKLLQSENPPHSVLALQKLHPPAPGASAHEIYFSGEGFSASEKEEAGDPNLPKLHLVDPAIPRSLDLLFSKAVPPGGRQEVQDFLRELVPAFEKLEIHDEADEGSQLHIVKADGTIPVAASGDGIQSFAQLALELAAISEGLALIEAPGTYQHPRAIWQSAKALLTSMCRGVQIVVATHSLELIDAILGQAPTAELENIALFNLALEGGQLRSSRASGEELSFARLTLEHDPR